MVHVISPSKSIKDELQILLDYKDIMWAQKARQQWLIKLGRSTSYCHTLVKQRWINNKITRIKDFFRKAYYYINKAKTPTLDITTFLSNIDLRKVSNLQKQTLQEPISDKEIEIAPFHIGSNKAPGLDVFPAIFFQKHWDLLKNDIIRMMKSFFFWKAILDQRVQSLLYYFDS